MKILLIIVVIIIIIITIKPSKELEEKYRNEQISVFWEWFVNNNKKLSNGNLSNNELEKGRKILHSIDNNSSFDIMLGKNKEGTLILTANGILESFPQIEKIYDEAPKIPNWKIVKFKPSNNGFNEINYEGNIYSKKDFSYSFLVQEIKNNTYLAGMNIYYKGLNKSNLNEIQAVSLIFIDHILGEYEFTTKIRGPINFYNLEYKKEEIYSFNELETGFSSLLIQYRIKPY